MGNLMSNKKFRAAWWGSVIFALIYAVVMFAPLGSETFFIYHTTLLSVLAAALSPAILFNICRHNKLPPGVKFYWRLILTGFVLWVLAEFAWFYYEVLQGGEISSLPLVFWVVGYAFLLTGIYKLYRYYSIELTAREKKWLMGTSAFFLALAVYKVLWPIIVDFSAASWAESLFYIVYPFLDISLVLLTLLMAFSLGKGRLGVAWRMLTAGFIGIALSNMAFVYLAWNEIYYPDGVHTFSSLASDYFYVMSYLVVALGFYAYATMLDEKSPNTGLVSRDEKTTPLLAQNFLLLFTDGNNKIISCSPLLVDLLQKKDCYALQGEGLSVLFPDEFAIDLTHALRRSAFVAEMFTTVRDSRGEKWPVRVSALSILRDDRWAGANIVVSFLRDVGRDDDLDDEMRGMLEYILSRAGLLKQEQRETVVFYANEYFNSLWRSVRDALGQRMADNFARQVKQAMQAHSWPVFIEDGRCMIPDEVSDDDLRVWMADFSQAIEQEAQAFFNSAQVDALRQGLQRDMDRKALEILTLLGILERKE